MDTPHDIHTGAGEAVFELIAHCRVLCAMELEAEAERLLTIAKRLVDEDEG